MNPFWISFLFCAISWFLLVLWQLPLWILPFWILPFSGFIATSPPLFSTWPFFLFFLIGFLVFCQDFKTRHFGWIWLLVGILVMGIGLYWSFSWSSRLLGVFFGLFSLIWVKKHWLGLADAIGFCCIGFSLSLQGLCFVIILASLTCWIYGRLAQERLLPFLSFIGWGYCIVVSFLVQGIELMI